MRRWMRGDKPGLSQQAGFSLIEIVVGLALISLTVALMPGTIRLGLNAWSARGDIEKSAGFALVLEALQQRIEQALPVVERGQDGSVQVLFAGDATTLEYVGVAETGPQGAGVYRSRIAPQSDDSARPGGLAIETVVHGPGSPPSLGPLQSETKLLAGPEATFRFRYFGVSGAHAKPQWHEAWRRGDTLPLLVEIDAEMQMSSQLLKRRIVIAPRVALRS